MKAVNVIVGDSRFTIKPFEWREHASHAPPNGS
jgi:hypothetical protein